MSNKYQDLTTALETIKTGSKIAIELHQGPDPDAMAAGLFFYELLRKQEHQPTITHAGNIGDTENRLMASKLAIPLQRYTVKETNGTVQNAEKEESTEVQPDKFDYFFFVDHSGNTSPWYQQKMIDPDKLIGIVDHHNLEEAKPEISFTDVRAVGSASTIAAEYLRDGAAELFSEEELERLSTALFFGLIKDTDNLRKGSYSLDHEMHRYLSEKVDMDLIRAIENPDWGKKMMDYYGRAIDNRQTADGVTVTSVGYIDPDDREVIPRTADFLLIEGSVHTVYVMGIRADIIDVFIRTSNEAFDFAGGGRKGAGRLEIPNQFAGTSFVRPTPETADTIEQLVIETFKQRVSVFS